MSRVTEALCGPSFSESTVGRLVGSVDADLAAWRERPLETSCPYLIIDARYEYVPVHGQVISQGVLIVKGVREDGRRALLAVEVTDTENEVAYEDLIRRLEDRCLTGVRLVTSDDHRGLAKAIQKHFQGASWQRYQVHVARNALGKVARKEQRAISEDVRAACHTPTFDWARQLEGEVVDRWAASHPQVAAWLATALEDGLACFAFPESHRRRIRSNNGLERVNQELKRRTRVVRIFPNQGSAGARLPAARDRHVPGAERGVVGGSRVRRHGQAQCGSRRSSPPGFCPDRGGQEHGGVVLTELWRNESTQGQGLDVS